jgi:xanthine dehydrogenase small subunit
VEERSPAGAGQRIRFLLNDAEVDTGLPPGITALDFLRHHRRLRGTKEGCREGECGACTVLVGRPAAGGMVYRAAASCLLPLAELAGTHVLTVEGLGPRLSPVQKELCEQNAIQCGFCTPGIVMALTGFFSASPALSEQDAVDALDGNICRCTGYVSIRRAARTLSERYRGRLDPHRSRCEHLVEWGILPASAVRAASTLALPRFARDAGAAAAAVPLIGGATDLLVQDATTVEEAEVLRFARDLPGARGIAVEGDRLVIGAATTIEELRVSPEIARALPSLSRSLGEDLKLVASTPLRNQATVAGNLVNASPIGDLSVMLLALEARLVLRADGRRREVALGDFFRGYRAVDLSAGEAVQSVLLPIRPVRFHFEKVSRRRVLDIASVNSALCVEGEGNPPASAVLSAGGVGPVPLLLRAFGRSLARRRVDALSAAEAIEAALGEIAPISDVRGSASYKRLALRNLIVAHLAALFPDTVDAAALLEACR